MNSTNYTGNFFFFKQCGNFTNWTAHLERLHCQCKTTKFTKFMCNITTPWIESFYTLEVQCAARRSSTNQTIFPPSCNYSSDLYYLHTPLDYLPWYSRLWLALHRFLSVSTVVVHFGELSSFSFKWLLLKINVDLKSVLNRYFLQRFDIVVELWWSMDGSLFLLMYTPIMPLGG